MYESFQFSILKILHSNLSYDEVIDTENKSKYKLLTRKFELNDN